MPDMDVALKDAMMIEGAIGVALVDYTSGMALGTAGGGKDFDLTIAAAGNTEVVRAKMRTLASLEIRDSIEDILITLGKHYHIIRPLSTNEALFIYLVLDKNRANLAMARHQLREIERTMVVV